VLTLRCTCGETYYSDENHIGSKLLCRNCGMLISIQHPIASEKSVAPFPKPGPPASDQFTGRTEPLPRQGNRKAKYKWDIPDRAKGLIRSTKGRARASFLVVGLILIVGAVCLIVRKTTNSQPNSRLAAAAPTPPPVPAIADNGPHLVHRQKQNYEVPGKSPQIRPTTGAPEPYTPEVLRAAPKIPKEVTGLVRNQEVEPSNPNVLPDGAAPLGPGLKSGHSVLSTQNGTDTDALVRVIAVPSGRLIRNFFVGASHEFRAEEIPPGNYVLRVALGRDWNEQERRFNYRRSFEETESFEITESATEFSEMTITLHKVLNGNFRSHAIGEEQFWR
jgi:hypothetical protein